MTDKSLRHVFVLPLPRYFTTWTLLRSLHPRKLHTHPPNTFKPTADALRTISIVRFTFSDSAARKFTCEIVTLTAITIASAAMPPLTRSRTLKDRLEAQRDQLTTENHGRLRFPGLPAEVKLMVYEHLLPSTICIYYHDYPEDTENQVRKIWRYGPHQQHEVVCLLKLLGVCRTIRDDLRPLIHRKIKVQLDFLPGYRVGIPTLWTQKQPPLLICSSLVIFSMSIIRKHRRQEAFQAGTIAKQLGRMTQVRQLTLLTIANESINQGRTWLLSAQSTAALRLCAKSMPWLSKVFYQPTGSGHWPRPRDRWLWWGKFRFALPGATSNGTESRSTYSKKHRSGKIISELSGMTRCEA